MFKMPGKYAEALIMLRSPNQLEESAKEQIQRIINHHTSKGTQIRIMADVHAGYGVPIGFTQTLGNYVIPNLIGVDIGCGVSAYPMGEIDIDWETFDKSIKRIPHGFHNRNEIAPDMKDRPHLMSEINYIADTIGYDSERAFLSCGSLGGGNHFIEVDEDPTGCKWIVIHSGSRGFGYAYATYFQNLAKEFIKDVGLNSKEEKDFEFLPLTWLQKAIDYIKWLRYIHGFASLSRMIMLKSAVKSAYTASSGINIEFNSSKIIESVHNYIDIRHEIIRKGAISAQLGEKVIIPLNMRDGTIIGTGKGSKKWNYSAPHGAGRIMSRKKAKASLDVNTFRKEMKDVYTSCADAERLDEAPMAYKDKDVIIEGIKETVDIDFVMKSIYNFKA